MKLYAQITLIGLIGLFNFITYSSAQEKLIDKNDFIDYYYENASPLKWNAQADTAIIINFLDYFSNYKINTCLSIT